MFAWIFALGLVALQFFGCTACLAAQAAPMEDPGTRLVIRNVRVLGWKGSLPKSVQELAGRPYEEGAVQRAEDETAALAHASAEAFVNQAETGAIALIYTTHRVHDIGTGQVDVDIAVYPLVYAGSDLTTNLRAEIAALYGNAHSVTAAPLNLSYGYDSELRSHLDATLRQEWQVAKLAKESLNPSDIRVRLQGTGMLPLENSLYRASGELGAVWRRPQSIARELRLSLAYLTSRLPLSGRTASEKAGLVDLSATLAPDTIIPHQVLLGATYRDSDRSIAESGSLPSQQAVEDGVTLRTIVDGRIPFRPRPRPELGQHGPQPLIGGPLWRAALWADGGSPRSGFDNNYWRVEAFGGIQREVALRENEAISVDLITGFGVADSRTPRYARFYGGSALSDLLYTSNGSPQLQTPPTGPILRSFGYGRSGGRAGARSFVNVSLTASFPVRGLYRPIIPPGVAFGDVTIKDLIARAAPNQERAVYRTEYKRLLEKYHDEKRADREATAAARRYVFETTPIGNYIAYQANLYSIKPMTFVDFAHLEGGGPGDGNKLSVGAGIQVSVVTARLELGYGFSVIRSRRDPSGSVFARLVIANIF